MNHHTADILSQKSSRYLRGLYDELSNYDVLHDITVSTPLTYPDLKFLREIILELLGVGRCYRCPDAHSAKDLACMFSDTGIRSELYRHTGLDYIDFKLIRDHLDKCCNYYLPYRPADHYEHWFSIDWVSTGNEGSHMLDMLLPYKSNIMFGWRDKELKYQDIESSGKTLPSGYYAISLYLICQDEDIEILHQVSGRLINNVLNNDLGGSSMCLGSRMSHLQAKRISSGYDPLDIIHPLIIKDSAWKKNLLPALNQFQRYNCL